MKKYLVEIFWEDPYPKNFSYTPAGSNISVAVSRALKQFRQEQAKGRKLVKLTIKVIKL